MSTKQIARDLCLAPERVGDSVYGGRYRLLFENLPALDSEDEALHALGSPGGICDDDADPSTDGAMAAGWPFFGQFIAHDITADRSPLGHRADPEQVKNFRTPRANLEGVYGAGPTGSPYLFQRDDPAKLLLGEGGHDVPRNHEGIALVGDQRNDTHLFMSQMQLGFIKTHNRIVDRLREDGVEETEVFDDARRATTWHYQWVILREFLPLLIGPELMGELLDGGATLFRPGRRPVHPLRVRRRRLSLRPQPGPRRLPGQPGPRASACFPRPDGIRRGAGGSRDRLVPAVRLSPATSPRSAPRRSTASCPASLISLPRQISGEDEGSAYASLANRDLQRGQAVGLPSGEAVARELGRRTAVGRAGRAGWCRLGAGDPALALRAEGG